VIRASALAAAVLLLLLAAAAPAARAHVVNGIQSCVIGAQPVVFGTVTENAAATTVGRIVLTCEGGGNNKRFTVALSQGLSSSFLPRHMFNLNRPGADLSYNLFLDAAHTQVWGNGQGPTRVFVGTLDFGLRQEATATLLVFARVPPQSGLAPGAYADQIIVTLVF